MGTRSALTDAQLLALAALEQQSCEMTSRGTHSGKVNTRAVLSLQERGFVHVEQTLLGRVATISDAGREALAAAVEHERNRPRRHYAPKRKYRKAQTAGALCVQCNYRPARMSKRHPHLSTNYCSDDCRQIDSHKRREQARVQMANEVRELLQLPAGRGADFTAPELQALLRRLRTIIDRQRRRATHAA